MKTYLSFFFVFLSHGYLLQNQNFSAKNYPLIETEILYGNKDGTFKSGEELLIAYKIKNKSALTLKAIIAGSISTSEKKTVHGFQKQIEVPPNQIKEVYFEYLPEDSGLYSVFVRLRRGKENLLLSSQNQPFGG